MRERERERDTVGVNNSGAQKWKIIIVLGDRNKFCLNFNYRNSWNSNNYTASNTEEAMNQNKAKIIRAINFTIVLLKKY